MKSSTLDGSASFQHVEIKIPSFEVSWAGRSPVGTGFCYGSEDGKIAFSDENGVGFTYPESISESGEAVNGVAAFENWFVVSTRAEMTAWSLPTEAKPESKTLIPHGSYGILQTKSNRFLAPIGLDGIAEIQPTRAERLDVTLHDIDEKKVHVYRLAAAPAIDGDLIAAACRFDGVGFCKCSTDGMQSLFQIATVEAIDVVDVCSIATSTFPSAFAAVGKNGTLIFVKKPFTNIVPLTTKYKKVTGTAYRILSCRGHVFVLTSDGIFMLANIVDQMFGNKGRKRSTTHIFVIPLEAVDMNLYLDKWLLVIMPDAVWRIDIEQIHNSIPENDQGDISQDISSRWSLSERLSRTAEFALL